MTHQDDRRPACALDDHVDPAPIHVHEPSQRTIPVEVGGLAGALGDGAEDGYENDGAQYVGSTERLLDSLSFRLARFGGRAAAAAAGGSVYVILADATADATRDLARRLAGEVLRSPASLGETLAVAAGSHEARLEDVPRSRRRADLVMDVLRQRSLGLAVYEDVEAQALVARARRCIREDPDLAGGLLDQVAAHDATHGSHHLVTLSAYFRANGSVEAAAGVLGLHKNTVRQRLANIASTFALDLSDPDVGLGLALVFG